MIGPLRWLVWALQGVGIGVANVIPGVSGGTMALVFGIYEKLISLLSDAARAGVLLLRFDWKGVRRLMESIDWAFLLWLSLGVLVAPLL